ncbi:uncharacterized protein K452DRAFT_285309 [Aplosporella prunicola CBS 121167]|uniref:Calcineurin-like phosphoesterase domain-containing protein n=1 Tax=Aplosporella prunicola CBS 121167 TaxID=1176127 RepID=A0A6A6BL32_9PEZI|nr:uncharacterized protein K452DRAFT_285309 [Aplosporella prunicola CBS 121167]KAF2144093.1 hypothetical protein K452DRAFT_285309 [Aplosporella prunicola CBS 121167]
MRDFETAIEKERQSGVLLGRFVFLDKTRVDLSSKVTILGCTLFSDILTEQKELVSMKLKDFDNIDDWAIEDHKAAYNADLAWLNDQVSQLATSEPHLQVTILTHYSPTLDPRSMDPRHTGSKIFSGFMTDLSNEICWNSPVVKTWIFGHTHFNCDFVDEGTRKRILANQRGYSRSPSKGFDPEKTVTLG